MSEIISAYIQKDGAGMWLSLPADRNSFQKAMSEIGAVNPTDMTIGQYKADKATIPADLLMNADLNHVNYLAARLVGMDEEQFTVLNAIMQSPFRFTTVEQLIDYADNKDYFLFRPGINNAEELGRYYVYDTGLCQMPEKWKGGIDLKRFGVHAAKHESGVFTTKGYLMPSGDEWHYKLAKYGIPGEYCLYRREK